MKPINKILIANRGEIAVRVIRTARDLGFRTVAVVSEADAGALHVQQADEAVLIGGAAVGESYLLIENIINAALATGADAIHPGYGFLSENADFAERCEQAGLVFIGPSANAIRLMGSKRLSKIAMLEAGVPCIPGYQEADQSESVMITQAQGIGFPLMVKASKGGGGRGMRLVHSAEDLPEQLKAACSEAESAFGNGELILEKAVIGPRHIEIQVFADAHGNVIHLGERDCSIQRRHQKVVEEAPSPFVDQDLRDAMGKAAVNAAKACQYRGAGTVEFLVDQDKQFYFLEMNTRLQVEHPVTELVTGLDLVAMQIKVAAGETLPITQKDVRLSGHAVEVRLYAEDPRQNFMPQTGQCLTWQVPEREGVRVDHGIREGQAVTPFYDPMLAKIIAYGDNRQEAIRRLASAVTDTTLLGVNHNKHYLHQLLTHEVFSEGGATTAFIDQHMGDQTSKQNPTANTLALAAAILFHQGETEADTHRWSNAKAWRHRLLLNCNDQSQAVYLEQQGDQFKVSVADFECSMRLLEMDQQQITFIQAGVLRRMAYTVDCEDLFLDDGIGLYQIADHTHRAVEKQTTGSGQLKASMDGMIVELKAVVGERVSCGQTLVVLEAMKMEHQLKASIDGVLESVLCEAGQQVKTKQLLAVINADEESSGE